MYLMNDKDHRFSVDQPYLPSVMNTHEFPGAKSGSVISKLPFLSSQRTPFGDIGHDFYQQPFIKQLSRVFKAGIASRLMDAWIKLAKPNPRKILAVHFGPSVKDGKQGWERDFSTGGVTNPSLFKHPTTPSWALPSWILALEAITVHHLIDTMLAGSVRSDQCCRHLVAAVFLDLFRSSIELDWESLYKELEIRVVHAITLSMGSAVWHRSGVLSAKHLLLDNMNLALFQVEDMAAVLKDQEAIKGPCLGHPAGQSPLGVRGWPRHHHCCCCC
jgi:hypothetical protein